MVTRQLATTSRLFTGSESLELAPATLPDNTSEAGIELVAATMQDGTAFELVTEISEDGGASWRLWCKSTHVAPLRTKSGALATGGGHIAGAFDKDGVPAAIVKGAIVRGRVIRKDATGSFQAAVEYVSATKIIV